MTMQTDVKSARLTQSGWLVSGPTRIKSISIRAGNGANTGRTSLFDTNTAPVAATYAQSGTTVTVTKVAHGLNTGDIIGITYYPASGVSATNGNYTITRTGADTFTITDPNSNTVAGGTTCLYAPGSSYMFFFAIASGDVYQNALLFPGEGIKASKKVYAYFDAAYVFSVTVLYG
jgi:hypothetical protein